MRSLSPILVGSLISCLGLSAQASTYVGPGGPIPDAPDLEGPPGQIVSEVLVSEAIVPETLFVTVTGLTHSWCGDVVIRLTHVPTGTSQDLVRRIGVPINPPPNSFGDSSNYGGTYVFADGGGDIWLAAAQGGTNFVIPPATYRPSSAGSGLPVPLLGAFAGIDASGTWRLTIQDAAAGDTGSFTSWTLHLTGSPVPLCPTGESCFQPHATPGCSSAICCDLVCAVDASCCQTQWDEDCVLQAIASCAACGEPSAGDCCAAHDGPACANADCCATICAVDIACCEIAWDALCAAAAQKSQECGCPTCPGEGSCFLAHPSAGCDDAICCSAVCVESPQCCEASWDLLCVDEALAICARCGDVGNGACCVAHAGPGCADQACCAAVCAVDLACCGIAWDAACAEQASLLTVCACPICPTEGSCFEAHGGPGCESEICCSAVCAEQPTCCEIGWDLACVGEALASCTTCGEPDAGPCCSPHQGPGCGEEQCCVAVCLADAFCCTSTWDLSCVTRAAADPACGCTTGCSPTPTCCFTAHGQAGCKDKDCCDAVCGVDIQCCVVAWDTHCALQAIIICCPSDLNEDGLIDGADLGLLLPSLYGPAAPGSPADLDCSGVIDAADLGLLLSAWGDC